MASQLQGTLPFSASTADITFNGTSVGQMQNLRWSEVNNLRRVNAIGSSVPVSILKGIGEPGLIWFEESITMGRIVFQFGSMASI